ncbi:unnamed protein product [Phaeothamnion confervicola]
MTTIMAISLSFKAGEKELKYWPIYLTNWSLVIEVAYLWMAFILSLGFRRFAVPVSPGVAPGQLVKPAPFVIVAWFFRNVSYVLSLAVFALFWLLVYDGGNVAFITPQVHGVNLFFTAVDAFFSAAPYYFLHVWQPFVVSLLYVIWSIIHEELNIRDDENNDYIYSTLNWNHPGATIPVVVVILFVGLPIAQAIMWCVWILGKRLTNAERLYEELAQSKDPNHGGVMSVSPPRYGNVSSVAVAGTRGAAPFEMESRV